MFKSLLLVLFISLTTEGAERPHVIVIVADDLGWNDVSYHGSDQIPTPNLDALAYDGMLLTNYYVQPVCTPSRSALMTGRYPIHTGLQHSVILMSCPYGLGLNETLLPQYLKELGYATHIVGKWHLGYYAKELTPTYRGFDSHFGYLGGKEDYWDHTNQEGKGMLHWGLDLYDDLNIVKDQFGQYSTDIFTERAQRIIEDHDTNKPLFLYLPYQAIHSGNGKTPLEAPWEYMQKFQHIQNKGRRTVAAMVSCLDDAIGNITRSLHARGMLKNAIIAFSTDNGGPTDGYDQNHANNFPLRGIKSTLWEGGMRGDGFLWSPLLKHAPRHSNQLMHITDWLPTILSAAGYDTSKLANRSLDGIDQWKELSEALPGRRKEILHNIDPIGEIETFALRVGDYKIIYTKTAYDGWYAPEGVDLAEFTNMTEKIDTKPTTRFPTAKESTVGKILLSMGRGQALDSGKPFKVECGPKPANASTNCVPNKKPCLYNVVRDPCEYNNIADHQPDLVAKLYSRMKQYRTGMVWPKNKPEDPKGLPGNNDGIWKPWIEL